MYSNANLILYVHWWDRVIAKQQAQIHADAQIVPRELYVDRMNEEGITLFMLPTINDSNLVEVF